MYYIEQKYTGIFTEVHQIGLDGQEPAKLFKINWGNFGLKNEQEQLNLISCTCKILFTDNVLQI